MQKTCIVIPCYNESQRLNLSEFKEHIQNFSNVDFLFVNDGSSDNTLEILTKFKYENPERVFALDLSQNSGKAEAVRNGILHAASKSYDFIGFFDADLATPLSEIGNFLQYSENRNITIIMGSRIKRLGANVERKTSRHIFGRVFSTFASIILKMPVYDTQCGAKLFRKELSVIFEEKFKTSWLFDVELLARYRNLRGLDNCLGHIMEVPVKTWLEKGGSKLKLKHLLKVPFELLMIHRTYNR